MDLDVSVPRAARVPRPGMTTVQGTGLTTMADGTELGIMMVRRRQPDNALAAKLMVAPGGGKEDYVGWVEVGSTLSLPTGRLRVASIVPDDQGGPRVTLEPA